MDYSFSFLLVGIYLKFHQDKGKIGGKIAWSKSFWLSYTLISWFALPLYFYFKTNLIINNVLMAICLSFWVRGVIELFMMFVTKNWKPLYGITHNLFTLALAGYFLLKLSSIPNLEKIYVASIFISLMLETYYAYYFHKHVGKETEGDEAIWFASKEDPKFQLVLKVTTVGDIYVYGSMFYFLLNH